MKKNNNHTTPKNTKTTKVRTYEDLKRTASWRERGVSKKVASMLAEEIFQWAQQDDALSIEQFCLSRGMLYQTLHQLKGKHDVLDYAYQYAKQMIGVRRELLAITKAGDGNIIIKTLHYYHPAWEALHESERAFKRELAAKDQQKPTHITVLMDDYGKDSK